MSTWVISGLWGGEGGGCLLNTAGCYFVNTPLFGSRIFGRRSRKWAAGIPSDATAGPSLDQQRAATRVFCKCLQDDEELAEVSAWTWASVTDSAACASEFFSWFNWKKKLFVFWIFFLTKKTKVFSTWKALNWHIIEMRQCVLSFSHPALFTILGKPVIKACPLNHVGWPLKGEPSLLEIIPEGWEAQY